MKNLGKRVFSFTMNVGVTIAAWQAVKGDPIATNFVYAWAGMSAFVGLMLFASDKGEIMRKLSASQSTLPPWVSHVFDALIIAPLIAYGWWWCVAAHIAQWLLCCRIFDLRKAYAKAVLPESKIVVAK